MFRSILFFILLSPTLLGCSKQTTKIDAPSESAGRSQVGLISIEGGAIRNLGLKVQGEQIRESFQFVNEYSTPIEIIRVSPSCACAEVGSSTNRVMPGELCVISVNIDTKMSISKDASANVVTNFGIVSLHLSWDYSESLQLDLVDGIEIDVFPGEKIAREYAFSSEDILTESLTGKFLHPDKYDTSIHFECTVDINEDSCRIAVDVTPESTPVIVHGAIVLEDSRASKIVSEIPCTIRVRNRIDVSPSVATIVDRGDTSTLQILVTANDESDLSILELKCTTVPSSALTIERVELTPSDYIFNINGRLDDFAAIHSISVVGNRSFEKYVNVIHP